MNGFDYVGPASVNEAAKALAAENATAIAGGHTLIPTLKQRLAKPSLLVDLGGIPELKGIRREGNVLAIGATTTHAEVASSKEVQSAIPALAKLADGIGDAQVRHRGTIGGSVANNDPAADIPPRFLPSTPASLPTNARSTRTSSSKVCLRPLSNPARSSWRSVFPYRSKLGMRNSSRGLPGSVSSALSWRGRREASFPRATCGWPSLAQARTVCSACLLWSRL